MSAISLRLAPVNCEFQRAPVPALLLRAAAGASDVAGTGVSRGARGCGSNELMKFLQGQTSARLNFAISESNSHVTHAHRFHVTHAHVSCTNAHLKIGACDIGAIVKCI